MQADLVRSGNGSMTRARRGSRTVGADGVLVVIPALNEEASVRRVVEEVHAAGYPALVVDDGSVDRTAEVAERAGATVLRLPVNLGRRRRAALRLPLRGHARLRGRGAVRRRRPARPGPDREAARRDGRRARPTS